MDKQYFYDANKVKWIIESAPKKWGYPGLKVWIHVEGDNLPLSGFVGETVGETFADFITGGYLYEN